MAFSGFLVCLLIMGLDIIAGILGTVAQSIHETDSKDWAGPILILILAVLLGFVASVLLVLAQVTGICFAGCVCICTKEDLHEASAKKKLAAASHMFSWITLAVGLTMLIIGIVKVDRKSNHFFFIEGLACFIHGPFTIAYIVSAIAAAREDLASGIQNPLEKYLRVEN